MRNFDFKRYTPRPKKLLRASLSLQRHLFFKSDDGHVITCEEKRAFSSPRRVALGTPISLPSEFVRTDGRAYADARNKNSRIDRVPGVLTCGAQLRTRELRY